MAVIPPNPPTLAQLAPRGSGLADRAGEMAEIVTWTPIATGDTTSAVELVGDNSIEGSVQVTGTFGGGTVALERSNDNTNWAPMKDVHGAAISFTSAGMAEFETSARYIRPALTGGTAASITVTIMLRG